MASGRWVPVAVLLLAATATADGEEPRGFLDRKTLTDGWFGADEPLKDAGISVTAFLLDDFTHVQRGGLNPHSSANRYWFELRTDFDLARIGLPEGGKVSAAYWQLGGENGTKDVPAFQALSVYESDFRQELGELFVEQTFGGAFRAKVGKMDATYDFTYTDYGNDFMNLGVSFPPNLLGIPTIPDPSVGGALFYEPEEGPYAGAGLFDGALQEGIPTGQRGAKTLFGEPSDLYGIFEGGVAGKSAQGPWRLGLGAWRHNGDFPEFGGGSKDGTTGWYGILEGRVVGGTEDDRGLYGILRLTGADEEVSPIERQWVVAAIWKGPIPGRPKDSLGVAYMVADLSDEGPFRSATEQVIEGYYQFAVAPFLTVMPDVQWIANGGGGVGDTLVVGFRVVVDF